MDERSAWLQASMQAIVEGGGLTAGEQDELVDSLSRKLQKLAAAADAAGAPDPKDKSAMKKAAKKAKAARELETQLAAVDGRPAIAHGVKHAEKIKELRKELKKLQKIEAKQDKGQLLDIKETVKLGKRPKMLEEMAELAKDSRTWFETEKEWEAKLKGGKPAARKVKASLDFAAAAAKPAAAAAKAPVAKPAAAPAAAAAGGDGELFWGE